VLLVVVPFDAAVEPEFSADVVPFAFEVVPDPRFVADPDPEELALEPSPVLEVELDVLPWDCDEDGC
jgi:hypothetical protein